MGERGTGGQAAGDNITWRMRIACWVTKGADITHSEYAVLVGFSAVTRVTRKRLNVTLCVP